MKIPQLLKKPHQHNLQLTDELLVGSPVMSHGHLKVDQDLHLDNKHSGNITVRGHLVIGPNATVEGDVTARSVDLEGALTGSLVADESIWLRASSSIKKGVIASQQLEINPGSQLNDVKVTTR